MEAEQNKGVPKILVLDDISINVQILKNIIEEQGYEVFGAQSVQEALDIMDETIPQLILSDYFMPGMNGLEFCRLLKSNPVTRDIPFIFITVADSDEEKRQAFEAGVADFIRKPFEPVEIIMRVNNQLTNYYIRQELEDYNRLMHKMVTEQKKQIEKERGNVLLALAKVLQRRNIYTEIHLDKVGHNCRLLAQSLQLISQYESSISDDFIEAIETASKLHDIGNILIPDEMLSKKYDSVQEKREEYLRFHTEEGARILEEISEGTNDSRFLNMAIQIARYHHARWDGTGWPHGIAGDDIPLAARIAAVANDFDALIEKRDGSEKHTVEESVEIINEGSGTVYDPRIIEVFNKVIKQVRTE